MLEINTITSEIVEKLKFLNPSKIILFGSYAYGVPRDNSDIDLFLLMNDEKENVEAKALFSLRNLMKKYKIGFDVLAGDEKIISKREDPFYRIDILQKGKVLYGK